MDSVFENWCDKLLDTGKGNRLINYKETKLRTVEILKPSIEQVFCSLTNGEDLSFYEVDDFIRRLKDTDIPDEDDKSDKNKGKFDKITKKFILDNLSGKISHNQLLSYKKGETLNKALNTLKKIYQTSINETGVNILYMAFGFLTWKESDNSEYTFKSPLILVPITLENESPSLPFFVKQYEEEINLNPTLKYKLETEFGIKLPEFQEDGHTEETIIEYLERVKKSVDKKMWEVSSDVVIGTFSFLKMNMYMDLKENESKILSNTIVRKLLNKETNEVPVYDEIDIDSFFKKGQEVSLHNVVDADSSQMEAIIQAKNGKSFVLQGPPGTGKSQTITNLIAEFLYDNKKVLFVSEKLAALNVVYSNLKKAGLSDYCLELHSNKTNKKDVIDELHRVLSGNKKSIKDNAEQEMEELRESKRQLDLYAEVLHTPIEGIEKTPYQILGAISKYRQVPEFEYAIKDIKNIDMIQLKKVSNLLETFSGYEDSIGYDYTKNPWYGFINININYEEKLELKKKLNELVDILISYDNYFNVVNSILNLSVKSFDDLTQNVNLLKTISEINFFDIAIFDKERLGVIIERLKLYNNNFSKMQESKAKFLEIFNEETFDLDLDALYLKFRNEYISKFRIFNSSYRKDKNILNHYKVDKQKKLKYDEFVEYLKLGKQAKLISKSIVEEKQNVINLFDMFKDGKEIDWQLLEDELSKLNQVMTENLTCFDNLTKLEFNEVQTKIKEVLLYHDNHSSFYKELNGLQRYFDETIIDFSSMPIELIKNKFSLFIKNFDEIDTWAKFYEVLCQISNLGIKEFVDESIKNNIQRDTLSKTFRLMFYKQLMFAILNENEILHNFSRLSQDAAVEKFKKRDKLRFELSKAEIISKLSKNKPDISKMAYGSEASILVREANKKRKQKPVRVLLKEIPALVQTLKPCFLMSPLSVSTYLSSDSCKFDVVIFDEASQIFPWDAIGAMSRAKQVIVVGDSKQMPPSNFFASNFDDDDDDEDDTLDFESILDLCSSIFSQNWLRWHYRSKTEDLIAFSNANFYHNNLITFPAAQKDDSDMGVNFYYVKDGVFDRSSKTNRMEAEKVADLVFEHFQKHPNRSLGVVAFSVAQQDMIEEIIRERRMQDDRYAKFFDSKRVDPFFVKNLETVQGDERDTIIFSVAYAKDSLGRFFHNFGPLNKKGGERRLNVAITRAKFNVKLVASIKSYDIDLSKTSAEGSKLLKDYLDCAENGMQNIQKAITLNDNEEPDSEFEIEVYDVLTKAGYRVDMQVGCSGYKIDLGVKHPEKEDYVLAVECDGATYHSSKTARDRDRLRQEVLERLGWRFYRIWSTDWFVNKQKEKVRLLDAVEKAIKIYNEKIEETDFEIDKPDENETFIDEKVEDQKVLRDLFPRYNSFDIDSVVLPSFHKIIYPLVEMEAPITEDLLLKKTVEFFDREKVTNVVRSNFRAAMSRHPEIKKVKDYYVINKDMEISLRIPKENEQPREIPMICTDEIAMGLLVIVDNNIGITKEGLFTTIVNLLGFNRIGTNIREKLEKALSQLLKEGSIKCEEDRYFVAWN